MNEFEKTSATPAMPLFPNVHESETNAAANHFTSLPVPMICSTRFSFTAFATLAVAGSLALSSCSHIHVGEPVVSRVTSGKPALDFTIERDLSYSPAGWPTVQVGDLYLPDSPVDSPPRPVVLLIHGGGWDAPERRSDMEGIAEKLAGRGYVVFNTTYRLAPAWTYPAAVEDLRQALRWLASEAEARNLDPDRIATWGYSAGGHLAALVGLTNEANQPPVRAIVAGGAPTDLTLFPGGKLVPQFIGGSLQEKPEAFRAASPVSHVDANDPPVFLYHATNDQLVPPIHADLLYRTLAEAGVPRELYWMKGRNHITGFLFEGGSEASAIAFLDRVLSSE